MEKEEIKKPVDERAKIVEANADGTCPVGYEWDATIPGCILQIGPPPDIAE